jgi:hypothetical protein
MLSDALQVVYVIYKEVFFMIGIHGDYSSYCDLVG